MKLIYKSPEVPKDLTKTEGIYVLYSHYIDDALIYIGSGSVKRAFSLGQRNEDWHKRVSEAGHVDVYFIGAGESETAIRTHELKLINRLRPRCNRYGNPDFSISPKLREARRLSSLEAWKDRTAHPNSVASCIENCRQAREERSKPILRSDGELFPSLAEAARAIPCSPSTITKRIQEGTSWKGFSFQYA